jgi:hypothetical protein
MSRFFSLVALTLLCAWPVSSLQAQDSFSITVSPPNGTELLSIEMSAQHSLLTLNESVGVALTLNSPSSPTGFGLVVSFPDKTFDKKIKDIGTKYPPQKWPLGFGTVTIGGHTLPTYRPLVPATPTKPKDAGSGTQGVVEVTGTTETVKVSSGVQGLITNRLCKR